MSTAEQSSPIMPYYSTSMPATTAGTTPVSGWPLSSCTPLSNPNCSPYFLGLTIQPAPAPFNPYVYNNVPTAMLPRMPSSSSVPTANCASHMDIFGAAPPSPDLNRFNATQASTSSVFASPCSSPDSLGAVRHKTGASDSNRGVSGWGSHELKRRRSTSSEPVPEAMTSRTALIELALVTDACMMSRPGREVAQLRPVNIAAPARPA
ncbi:hypothetical protein EHS25_000927 [Saitozyma podzolica]|uniref:Uncharacterized protein n=1 Tax=Saitozyma podzolica TaxID=1890683 RepID=A0A427YXN0_9TREE|nr:hypothetical protein EHS25_000927 [Saitozyma podzolica]